MKKDFVKKGEIMIYCYLIAAAPPCFLPRLKEGDRPGPCSQDHTWRRALANN